MSDQLKPILRWPLMSEITPAPTNLGPPPPGPPPTPPTPAPPTPPPTPPPPTPAPTKPICSDFNDDNMCNSNAPRCFWREGKSINTGTCLDTATECANADKNTGACKRAFGPGGHFVPEEYTNALCRQWYKGKGSDIACMPLCETHNNDKDSCTNAYACNYDDTNNTCTQDTSATPAPPPLNCKKKDASNFRATAPNCCYSNHSKSTAECQMWPYHLNDNSKFRCRYTQDCPGVYGKQDVFGNEYLTKPAPHNLYQCLYSWNDCDNGTAEKHKYDKMIANRDLFYLNSLPSPTPVP